MPGTGNYRIDHLGRQIPRRNSVRMRLEKSTVELLGLIRSRRWALECLQYDGLERRDYKQPGRDPRKPTRWCNVDALARQAFAWYLMRVNQQCVDAGLKLSQITTVPRTANLPQYPIGKPGPPGKEPPIKPPELAGPMLPQDTLEHFITFNGFIQRDKT